ncbi:Tetratricopeptide repeat protein 12 [Larimichthys crocea]|uniref:Tetratricopeptide repeat protein 12 n=1 Tax=Larimichthys crocea TaxID=215358 RepID=A0A6G0HFB5_LARCR|nr:Tetratricopeptide repeat protein 12 [Larimichthys crocea]
MLEIEPGKEKMVKEYLTQVDLEEERDSQEMNAMQRFDKGDEKATTVLHLLEKLSKAEQMPLYYCGGFEILSQAVTDCTGQTLFRLNNGFSIISSNDMVRSCLLQKTTDPDSLELCMSVLKLWRVICCGNDENQKMLMTCPVSRESIVHLLTSEHVAEHAVPLCDCCLGLLRDRDGGVITRVTGVLSTVLPQSSEAVQHVIRGDFVRTMCRLLKGSGQTATKYAIKTLTVCTAASHLAREELLKSDKKLSILRHLLASSCDEMVSGNAALCLAHCLELEGIASNLLGTDIVPLLLRHAAQDAKRTAVQRNAAIALGKLCRSEPRCPLTLLYKPHAVDYI